MIEIEGKNVDTLQEDWCILIILDACRYDIFKKVYKDILVKDGVLSKAGTNSAGTEEWMHNNFLGRDCSDIIYIDPIIMFDMFLPGHNFFKVDKVWKTRWDYEYGTIMPKDMTDSALEQIKRHPKKRFIIHYHQPHPPYLLPEFKGIDTIATPELVQKNIRENKTKNREIHCFIQGNIRKILGAERAWKLLIRLGITPRDGMGKIYKIHNMDGIIRGYTENLKMVLKDVNRLIDNYNGKIVITSDHSKNFDGSTKGLRDQYVPWLELNGESYEK